jgi:hypothetical protein
MEYSAGLMEADHPDHGIRVSSCHPRAPLESRYRKPTSGPGQGGGHLSRTHFIVIIVFIVIPRRS